jgi:iron complex outermembrane receptor protein
MSNTQVALGASALLLTTFVTYPIAAQQTPSPPPTTGQLQEVVVTAEKRAENLQDVPIAVTAVSAARLARTATVSNLDLNMLVPGLDMQSQGSYTLPAIRGVSTTLTTLGDEPNTATYIDGVYYPVSFGQFLNLSDIAQVEVLKGPQGTLFGRNATGGAILISTKDPSATPTGNFSVGYGRFGEVDLNGYLSGALSPTVTANVAAFSEKDHGWAENIFLHRHDTADQAYGFRSKIVYRPSDRARYVLSTDYSMVNNPPANFNVGGDSALKLVPGAVVSGQLGKTATNFDISNPIYQLGAGLTAQLNLGGFDLFSVTGLRQAHADGHFDIDNTSVPAVHLLYGPRSRSASEDLRLQSNDPTARLTWVVGANGYFDRDTFDPFIVVLPGIADQQQYGAVKTEAFALYGQTTDHLTGRLAVTLGLRASEEHKILTFSQDAVAAIGSPGVPQTETSHSWGDVSPKVTVDYQIAARTKGYATVAKGFKSGTYNASAFQTTPLNPETLWDYELGLKSDVNEHFRANVSAFYYSYKDIQVQAFGANALTPIDTNAAKAKMYGTDADLTAVYADLLLAGDSLNVVGGFSLLHAYYSSYPDATTAVELPFGGDNIVPFDATGKELVDAPRGTVNLTIDYSWPVPFGRLTFTPTAYYNSGYHLDSANSPRFDQGAFTRVNATLTWGSPDAHYRVSVWGKNLTNVKQIGGILISALGPVANGYPPATYGITLEYSF